MNGANSPVVTWEYAEEEEDAPLLIFIAVAIGFVAVALFIAAQRRPEEEKSYAIQDEPYDSSEDAEVEETTDASEMEAEESEGEDEAEEDGAEDAGEAPTKSIYDLQPDDE